MKIHTTKTVPFRPDVRVTAIASDIPPSTAVELMMFSLFDAEYGEGTDDVDCSELPRGDCD